MKSETRYTWLIRKGYTADIDLLAISPSKLCRIAEVGWLDLEEAALLYAALGEWLELNGVKP